MFAFFHFTIHFRCFFHMIIKVHSFQQDSSIDHFPVKFPQQTVAKRKLKAMCNIRHVAQQSINLCLRIYFRPSVFQMDSSLSVTGFSVLGKMMLTRHLKCYYLEGVLLLILIQSERLLSVISALASCLEGAIQYV